MKKIFLLIFICIAFSTTALCQFIATLAGSTLTTTGWNIGGFATVVDSFVQLTTAAGSENGYVYFDSLTNLTSCSQFDVKFDYQIYGSGGLGFADGIAFFYIANPPSGFVIGGGLGIPDPITGMIFTLDTWDNDGDALNPESQIFGYTTPSTYAEANRTQMIGPISGHETFMDDGTWHHCEITYNAGTINVYFDYSPTPGMTGYYLITIPGGYFGFSSSTGGGYSIQSVKSIYITANGIAPAPAISSPVVYCQNAAADTLIATGIGPFEWYTTDTATVVSLPGSPTPNTAIAGTTTYYVRQGVGSCISVPDSVKVIVKAEPPTPVISGETVYCQDTAFIPFTVSGASGTILWYTADTGGVGITTAPSINTTVPGTTTWWATQTVAGCESRRDSIKVTVHATPTLPLITGTTVYCQYNTFLPPVATLTGVGMDLLWYNTATGGLGTPATPFVNTSVAGAYNFYATQSDSGCISPRELFEVTVNPQPAPPVVTDIPDVYCPGKPFVPFTILSGVNVLWYTAATGGTGATTSPGINTSDTGVTTVWVTQTLLGCESDRASFSVTVAPNVTAGFSATKEYGCTDDTVVFTNTSTGALSYSWKFGDISPVSVADDPTHIYLSQGNYTVTLYALSANCLDSSILVVNLVHPLLAQFSVDTNLLCQKDSVVFTDASVATGPTYLWNFGDGSATVAIPDPTHKYLHPGVYKAYEVVTDMVPCKDTAFTTISIDSISPIYLNITDSVLCTGASVTFTGIYTSIGNTGITWNFGNGDSIKDINPVTYAFGAPGTYTVTASPTFRVCDDTSISRTVTIEPQPEIYIGPDTSICKGSDPLTLTDRINSGDKNAVWVWSTGQTSSDITVTEPGSYSATVRIDGCSASATINVSNDCFMNIPNVFSPNGDGLNDYFYPRQQLTSGLITFSMQIYNRWGQEIFVATSLDGRGWDGKFNNVDQPEGVYVYIVDGTFKDGQKEHHQGNVTLIR
jgi:gliding motility-associated-like protein